MSTLFSCTNEKEEGLLVSDQTIYDLTQARTSFTYFRNTLDTLQSATPPSPHYAAIRVRFNPRARTALNDSMTSFLGGQFPNESMIVKEIYDLAGGSLQTISVMYKMENAANSNSGWVWSEFRGDGTVKYSASQEGAQCVNCHSSGNNSDLVRTFEFH